MGELYKTPSEATIFINGLLSQYGYSKQSDIGMFYFWLFSPLLQYMFFIGPYFVFRQGYLLESVALVQSNSQEIGGNKTDRPASEQWISPAIPTAWIGARSSTQSSACHTRLSG